jgi:hypothetical protein
MAHELKRGLVLALVETISMWHFALALFGRLCRHIDRIQGCHVNSFLCYLDARLFWLRSVSTIVAFILSGHSGLLLILGHL